MSMTDEELDRLAQQAMGSDYLDLPEQPEPAVQTRVEAEGRPWRQVPDLTGDENALLANMAQGYRNVGAGTASVFAKLVKQLGIADTEEFLRELEVSQNMDIARTQKITGDKWGQELGGKMIGETAAFPVGGGSGGVLVSAFKAFVTNFIGGGLTSEGEQNEEVLKDALIAGGIGTTLDQLGAQAKRFFQSGAQRRVAGERASEITPLDTESIIAQRQAAEGIRPGVQLTGIELLPAQRTLNPYQVAATEFVGMLPEGSSQSFERLRRQNEQAALATQRILVDALGNSLDAGRSGARTSKTAENVISAAQLARTQATHPMFEAAFNKADGLDEPIIFDLSPMRAIIDPVLSDAPQGGKIQATLGKVSRMMGLTDPPVRQPTNRFQRPVEVDPTSNEPPSLRMLHNIKIEIDEMLEGKGDSAVGKTLTRHLMQVKDALQTMMETQSPDYRLAMDEFRQMSPAINNLIDGKIGQLADLDPQQYKNASKILFDAAETNPETMTDAIRIFSSVKGGRELISNLLRSEVERRMGRMKVDIMDVDTRMGLNTENVPFMLKNAIFGNTAQRKALMTALQEVDPEVARNAVWLEKVLDRAGRGRPGNSATAIRTEVKEDVDRVPASWLRNIFRRPIETVGGIGEQELISARRTAFADALFDPDYVDDMRNIRKLGVRKGIEAFDNLTLKILDLNLNPGGVMTRAGTSGLMNDSESADFYYDKESGDIRANN